MYPNLNAEMARNGVTQKDLAQVLGCSVGTVVQKLTGKSKFYFPEAKAIRRYLGADMPLDILFDTSTQQAAR